MGRETFPQGYGIWKLFLVSFGFFCFFSSDINTGLLFFLINILNFFTDHVDTSEAKTILEAYFSPVFQIFYDSFTLTESTLKQKSIEIFP